MTTIEDFFQDLNSKFEKSNINYFMNGPAFACYETLNIMLRELSNQLDISFAYEREKTGQAKLKDYSCYERIEEILFGDKVYRTADNKKYTINSDKVLVEVFQKLLADDYEVTGGAEEIMAQGLAISFFYNFILDETINIDLFTLLNHRALMLAYKIGQLVAFTPQISVEKIQQAKSSKTIKEKKKSTKEIVLGIFDKDSKMPKRSRNDQAARIGKKLPYKVDKKTGKRKKLTKRSNIIKILNKEKRPFRMSKS